LIYRVQHRTTYHYEDPVSVSHHVLRLTPRSLPKQTCWESYVAILPTPAVTSAHFDYFGNTLTFFTLHEPHECLVVEANTRLEVNPIASPDFSASPSWETVREALAGDPSDEVLNAWQFVFDTQRVRASPELAAYARESFPAGRPLLAAVLDLTRDSPGFPL
jgi:transglutaminase-like putative cysteine protease